jgi:hypothetical protein
MKIVGIDLGTTNSCVYYLNENGNPVLVTDRLDHKVFPSVVWSAGQNKDVVVAHKAKARVGHAPAPIVAVKRKMGTTETVNLGGQQVGAVEVSAHILSFLKALVEEVTGDRVGGAVVTVPAYFDAAPKQDTHRAAVKAFFGGDTAAAQGRIELQLEPEAAAFAYTIEDPAPHLRVLVYDLGGGTYDVTILEKTPELGLTVLKFGGDPHLGGDNIDDRIATWILYLLRGGKAELLDRILGERYPAEKRYTILLQIMTNDLEGLRGELRPEDKDLLIGASPRYQLDLDSRNPEDLVRIQKLKNLAENAKKDLTVSTVTPVIQQTAFQDQEGEVVDIDFTLSRGDFNRLIGDLVTKTIDETFRVLKEARLEESQIDRLLLVGGSTRMPVIREELAKAFSCPIIATDQDMIVARGAALRARDLNPPPLSDSQLVVEYPRETPNTKVTIKGKLNERLCGYEVFLSRSGEDVAAAPVNEDRFILTDVPLLPDADNPFHLEVVDGQDQIFVESDIVIRHNAQSVGPLGAIPTKVTKPIRALGARGFKTLFAEGAMIPAEARHTCTRATQGDQIVISFFEGERELNSLCIPNIDPSLPIGSAIDLFITLNKDYTVSATATIRATQQAATVEFQVSQIEIPPIETMDGDLEEALEHLENDLLAVHDPNERARLSRKARRLEADYKKASRELTPDLHNLYAIIGELRKLAVEVRGAQNFLDPPFEDIERLVNITRAMAKDLDSSSPVRQQDVLEKIAVLERTAKEIWDRASAGSGATEREDVATWNTIHKQLAQLKDDLDEMIKPPLPQREYPPEYILNGLREWLGDLRTEAEKAELLSRFEADFQQIERSLADVDLRQTDSARHALVRILQEQVRPLEHRMHRTIEEATGQKLATKDRKGGVIFET